MKSGIDLENQRVEGEQRTVHCLKIPNLQLTDLIVNQPVCTVLVITIFNLKVVDCLI